MGGAPLLTDVLLSTVAVFLLAVSLLGLFLGVALMLKSSATLPFIALMNRWVSTRQAFTRLDAPVHIAPGAAHSRWFGLVLAAVGAYAAVVLVGSFDVARLALLFKLDPRHSLGGIALEALKWTLVVGSLAALATGLMLLFFPRAWQQLEERANRWYSSRRLELADDTVYLPLDRMVEVYPRAAGGVLFVLSLLAAAASGLLLLARR